MARIIYPDSYAEQRTLFQGIKKKHTDDAAASVLIAYFTQQGIDLTADAADGVLADALELSRRTLTMKAETLSETRDLLMETPMKVLRGSAQFLKALSKPNVQMLGDFGFTVDNGKRIVIPPEFTERKTLFGLFKQKYDSYAPNPTPLDPFFTEHQINLTNVAEAVDDAGIAHDDFKQAEMDAENATGQRNLKWQPVNDHIHGIGDFLMKLYANNPKKLGDWGFTVDHSPRAPKVQKGKILPGAQKTVTGVVIGGTFENTGKNSLHLYKGKTSVGAPAIIAMGDKVGILKGFSVITIVNPSTTVTGNYQVLVNR